MTAIRAVKRGRKKAPPRQPGPSRIHNKRQQKLVKMVDGYDSTHTFASMVRIVMVAWTAYAIALIVTGVSTLGASPADPSQRSSLRLAEAVREGSGILLLLTAVLTITWMVQSRRNVSHLGQNPRIGLWKRIKGHVAAAVLGAVTLLFAFLSPDNAGLFVALTAGLWIYASLWLQFILLDTMRMLWRTSSDPADPDDDLPAYGYAWIVSWILYSSTIGMGEGVDLTRTQLAPVSMLSGVFCLVASVTLAMLVVAISRRQDARLEAIVNDVDGDVDGTPVTSSQIARAWSESEGLIELPGR